MQGKDFAELGKIAAQVTRVKLDSWAAREEAKALRKLRHPSRSRKLRAFLDATLRES